ncbi:MAG: SMP-30/gluconolactonase/LRE family protein [Maritimibacter sp.]
MVYAYREVASGLRFPEGPVVLGDGSVVLVEIAGRAITRVFADGTTEVIADCPGGPNGLALGPDGQIYICNNGGGFNFATTDGVLHPAGGEPDYSGGRIERLDLASGEIVELFREVEGRALMMPNDIVFDRQGGFYFTDFGHRAKGAQHYGALYYGRTDGGAPVRVAGDLISPNGVGLSPDERKVYVAETYTGRLKAFDIVAPGQVAGVPMFEPGRALHAQVEGFRRYDSLAVEADGAVCIGSLTPGGITVIDAQGKHRETEIMPDLFPTNIAFGGADMRTAFVTLSGSGRLIAVEWPRAGLVLNYQQR